MISGFRISAGLLLCALAWAADAPAADRPAAIPAGALVLAEGGRSDYAIVIAKQAAPPTQYAAEELRRFLKEISGVELPAVTDNQPPRDHEILLGDSTRRAQTTPQLSAAGLGEEGYLLRTIDQRLIIFGGGARGTLYGVYGLLTDHFGCRWFTPACC